MTGSPPSSAALSGMTLKTEFQELYRKPGARYLGLTYLFGSVGTLAFYL